MEQPREQALDRDLQPKTLDLYATLRHRGVWFFIDDADESTKSTFLLLRHLFTLQSGERPALRPVLTLPVGQ